MDECRRTADRGAGGGVGVALFMRQGAQIVFSAEL